MGWMVPNRINLSEVLIKVQISLNNLLLYFAKKKKKKLPSSDIELLKNVIFNAKMETENTPSSSLLISSRKKGTKCSTDPCQSWQFLLIFFSLEEFRCHIFLDTLYRDWIMLGNSLFKKRFLVFFSVVRGGRTLRLKKVVLQANCM